MPLPTLLDRFARLSTLRVADGCMRAGAPVRAAPPGLRPAFPCNSVAGRVRPARHAGSVDVFRGWLREIRGSIEE